MPVQEIVHHNNSLSLCVAVGQAFGEELYPHPDVLKLFFGDEKKDDKSNPWRKMAMVSQLYLS